MLKAQKSQSLIFLPSATVVAHPLALHRQAPIWADTTLLARKPHPRVGPRDGHCSGPYASYWNAFLFWNYIWSGPPKVVFHWPGFSKRNDICAIFCRFWLIIKSKTQSLKYSCSVDIVLCSWCPWRNCVTTVVLRHQQQSVDFFTILRTFFLSGLCHIQPCWRNLQQRVSYTLCLQYIIDTTEHYEF